MPPFVAEVLRERLVLIAEEDSEHLLFFSRRASGPDLAAEMLGHSSTKITKEHYIQPDERVDPVTADILEALAPRREGGQDAV